MMESKLKPKYIYKVKNSYVIRKSKHYKMINYGTYHTLEAAILARDELISNNWEIMPSDSRVKNNKTKYIYQNKNMGTYQIRKSIKGKNKNFGTYHTLEAAIKFRDIFMKSNWQVTLVKFEFTTKHKYIKSTNTGYEIYKSINGKNKYFGKYDTLAEAIKARNELIKNNWQGSYKPYVLNNPKRYITKNKTRYCIYKSINHNQIHINTFTSLEEAISERNLLEYYNWDYETLIYNEATSNEITSSNKNGIKILE